MNVLVDMLGGIGELKRQKNFLILLARGLIFKRHILGIANTSLIFSENFC